MRSTEAIGTEGYVPLRDSVRSVDLDWNVAYASENIVLITIYRRLFAIPAPAKYSIRYWYLSPAMAISLAYCLTVRVSFGQSIQRSAPTHALSTNSPTRQRLGGSHALRQRREWAWRSFLTKESSNSGNRRKGIGPVSTNVIYRAEVGGILHHLSKPVVGPLLESSLATTCIPSIACYSLRVEELPSRGLP